MSALQNTLSSLQQSADFALAFRIRQPQPAQPKALLVLLHGVGGSESNLGDLAAGIDPDTLVLLPRGPLTLGPGQFAWFRVAFTASGPRIEAQEAEQSRLALIHFVAQLQAAHGISPQQTVIAGFSQGGILSASVALTAPESVAGFGILSGRILPELEPHLAEPARLTALRAFIGHGEFDSKLPVLWAQRSEALLSQLGVAHSSRRYPIDHGISAAMQADFLQWLSGVLKAA
ncbi:phospholipase [Rhodoferax sp.]|uniref:alpha/beta hydrolase n=1 Tax=Rhodoferax sp. TaxID=50421 RepID=UPI0025DB0E8C|nr:phospholipase [Rhodoferax sp.]MCM2341442.1 phospholipase [Rhodoferax sp.]